MNLEEAELLRARDPRWGQEFGGLVVPVTALIPAHAIRMQAFVVKDCHVASQAPSTILRNSSASSRFKKVLLLEVPHVQLQLVLMTSSMTSLLTSNMMSLRRNDVITTSIRHHQTLQLDNMFMTSHDRNDVINDVIKPGVQPLQPSRTE